MCYGCEVREEARKKYVWKKLHEARATIKAIRKEAEQWDGENSWWYEMRISEILDLKRKEE